MILQNNIKALCKRRGITLQALAKEIGITYNTLNQQSIKNPSLRSLERIAGALGCEVWELLRPETETTESGPVCPHCGKPLHIEVTK